ncbi:DUF2306 domain-containing protein [Scleromatobacter humisilvae]|uniref:DUF2306 domain-containing protein n=1 Tax=Scleromatobacter humisilvae TaxID=2897159 RepID=A0A9X1YIW1_9BURK|nr:DUF2306 domain-containing protein [Scleromatobacter humisilvae]MCK9686741.1 DUF2306 domain-containing protein [Scleromatobacter humisilvae]
MSPPATDALASHVYPPPRRAITARSFERPLERAAAAWCAVAVAGQLMFAAYVLRVYGRALVAGRPELWNRTMPHAWVPGDPVGNAAAAGHLLLAVVVMLLGALQLVPALRRHAPAVHRWSGRVFVVAAMTMAVSGIYLMIVLPPIGDRGSQWPIVVNAALILAFAGLAWRDALARRLERHRRWALRLYLVVSGVWFFRIGLMAWIIANRGPAGFDPKTFAGPAITTLAIAQWALPLLVLEPYLRVRAHGSPRARLAMAGVLALGTLLTAFGIACATAAMWLPRM